jgi:trk system potassium uptake protein TrkA
MGMRAMIVGCGRAGAELANQLARAGHAVTVIDVTDTAFLNLASDFRGHLVEGEVLNRDVLANAGIAQTDCLATMTNSDALNAVVGHIAVTVYHVPRVVVRNYDPRWIPLHDAFELTAISSVRWNAERSLQLLVGQDAAPSNTLGEGVALYEVPIPKTWAGRSVGELVDGLAVVVASLVRRGHGTLPNPEMTLAEGDRLMVSAGLAAHNQLHARVRAGV